MKVIMHIKQKINPLSKLNFNEKASVWLEEVDTVIKFEKVTCIPL